jgi:predicted RNase H-like HicB family nuclease
MKYVYPVIFTQEDGQILVSVPDLPGCHTFGDDLAEAMEMARDAMAMWLCLAEENGETLPTPSLGILNDKEKMVTLVDVDTIEYRKATSQRSVKKTLTIPEWLNNMAMRENVNFSNVLQNALIEQLHIA